MRRRRRFPTRGDAFWAGRDDEATGGADPAGYVRAIVVREHADAYIAGARLQRRMGRHAPETEIEVQERAARIAARRLVDVGPDEEGPWP